MLKKIGRYILFSFLVCFCFIFKANASDLVFQNEELSLDIQTKKTTAGIDVLFEFSLKDGWHISWQNPGDAGVPTKFYFSGADEELIQTSFPQKFVYQDIITQYGFSDKAYYLFHLSNLSNTPSVRVSWTVCRDYCEPQEASFDLPVQTTPSFDEYFENALKTFPKLLEKPVPTRIKNGEMTLFVKDLPDDISYFIASEAGIFNADEEQLMFFKKGQNHLLKQDRLVIKTQKDKLPSFGIFITPNGAYKAFLTLSMSHIFIILLFAFLGGMVLNLMPCVFPVLSLKAFSMAQSVHSNDKHILKALSYTAGVVFSFLLIAGLLFVLKAGGAALGWGFQLQSPIFVLIMIVLFVLILLFIFDVIHFNVPFLNTFSKLSSLNSFFTGFFAVLIASPCTGPFMGAAVGYALFESPKIYFPVFLALGLGYALPFAMLEMFPNFLKRFIPKPGKWMQTVKYVLSVPVFLTIFWLCWVLYNQLNTPKSSDLWQPYTPQALEEALENGDAVFIDFTAKWCLTCLLNERTVLNSESFLNAAKENEILLLKADWTNQDSQIFDALKSYGRSSVPLYVFYPEDSKDYLILPQILTTGIISQTINDD